jgi:putative ABC transport system permease protein
VPVNARFYQEWRDACPAFSSLALIDRTRSTVTGSGDPIRVSSINASVNLFTTLRVTAGLGRVFNADEGGPGRSGVVILSDRFWRNRFSADPKIIGRALTLDQRSFIVIGVLPADFHLPEARQFLSGKTEAHAEPEIFLPKTFNTDELNEIVGRFNYEVVGRLAVGATLTEAVAQMNVVAKRLAKLSGSGLEVRSFLAPLQEAVVGPVRRGLFLLLGAIGAVLLIACLNLSILALARAERRGHELAVRSALGAGRSRLVRIAFTESLVLSVAGGALGYLFALWGMDILLRVAPADLPRLSEVRLNPTIFLFALGITIVTSVVTGLVPAWRAAHTDAADSFRSAAGRATTSGSGVLRGRQLLIGIESGVSLALLATAALLAASFVRLIRVDPGFHAPDALTTELEIPYAKYRTDADRNAYHQRLLAAAAATPGIAAAAISTALPLQGETWIDAVLIPGDSRLPAERTQTNVRFISADFFTALGIPLVAGRTFRDSDHNHKSVILSAQLAQMLFPAQDAVGRKILLQGSDPIEVIGVVGDARANVDQRPVPVLYQPYWAWSPSQVVLVARVEGSPAGVVALALRDAIRRVDPDVPVEGFHTMQDILLTSVDQRRFQLRLVAVFALSALTLVGLGIYGVVSHSVAQRTRELGIRLAFGAAPADVMHLVLRQGLKPIAWGLLGGVSAALIGGRFISGLLYETSPYNPIAFVSVAFGIALVALLACWLPARRATKVDPMVALRAE